MTVDNAAIVARYIDDVLDGRLIVGDLVRLAVRRHVQDLKDGTARGLIFDKQKALRAIRFFSLLRHSKGEWGKGQGKIFGLAPWQMFIIWCLFGWRNSADGSRRFRFAYIEVARKNGKSSFAAGVGLYLFWADKEPGAEVYTAATKRDQARIVHQDAVAMVRKSPELRQQIGIFKDNLHILETRSKFEPLGADGDTMDGLNVHGAIVDELHQHKTRAVLDSLDTATGSRRQPMLFVITTAGFNRNSACFQEREYSINVLENTVQNDARFAFIATLDKDDDPWDETVWVKANPNLGVSVKPEDLRAKAIAAREMASRQNGFFTKHLNIWTEQADRWLSLDQWNAVANSAPFVVDQFQGRECFGGLDLASRIDISALVLLFRDPDGGVSILPHFWIPKVNAAAREKKDRVPYLAWIRDGYIEATEGNTIDYEVIFDRIGQLKSKYDIAKIGFDKWGMELLQAKLQGAQLNVASFRQGFESMSEPSKEFERLILAGKLRHGGNPVLKWMIGNVAIETDAAGNIKPSKKKSIEKIDGVVASVMALGVAMAEPVKDKSESIYEQGAQDLRI